MGAFQLETIEPPNIAAPPPQPDLDHEEREAIRAQAYASGFQDGVDVTRTGMLEAQNALLAVIRETLEDQRFDMERANAAAEASVLAYVQAIGDLLAPGLLDAHFDELVMARAKDVLARALEGETVLAVSPDASEAMSELAGAFDLGFKVEPDAGLCSGQAELRWANGADRIDADQARQDIVSLTDAYASAVKEDQDERRRQSG